MNKKQSLALAIAGVSLLGASQARAQGFTYNNDDLLLDFRSVTSPSGNADVTVDEGNISTFVNSVGYGNTVVLDSGSGFTESAGYTTLSSDSLASAVGGIGSGNTVGFSAAAADSGSSTLWLSRVVTSGTLTQPSKVSAQQALTAQGNTANIIANIGAGANASGTTLNESSSQAVSVPSGNALSYQTLAQANSSTPQTISYGGFQNTASGAGGLLEGQQTGSASIYEALWEVPVSGTGSDTYEGYFTFKTDGEVDFTSASGTAVPEPSTYALFAVTGVLALAFRRQIRSLVA